MERSVDVATGESVAFSYELAGLGSRFIAVAIDVAIQIAVMVVAIVLFLWYGASQAHVGGGAAGGAVKLDATVKFGLAVLEGLAVFASFVLFFGYFILFEWRWDGRTPGKRVIGIRVVRDGGFALDFTGSVVRNVVRVLEFALGFYTLSAVATLLSPMNRRLGDMAAGTIVVRDGRFERDLAIPIADETPQRVDTLVRDLSGAERDLVRRYVERRESLGAESRVALAKRIAQHIRPKLAASFAHMTDDDLLVHVGRAEFPDAR